MSRRYPTADLYEERERDFYTRPRQERNYDELDVDIRDTRSMGPPRSRAPPAETIVSGRVTERERIEGGPRRPDFLKEDYGRTQAGPLVVRKRFEEEDDYYTRAPRRRSSHESMRSRQPPDRREEDIDIRIRERERESVAPSRVSRYPRTEFRESIAPSRAPIREERTSNDEIEIRIRKEESEKPAPPPPPPPESVYEEIRFRRGGGERPAPPPAPRTEVEEKDIDIRIREREQSRAPSPPRSHFTSRGRREEEDIDIRIRERSSSRPAPSRMSRSHREDDDIDIRIRERSASRAAPSRAPRGRTEEEDIDIRIRERSMSRPAPRSMSRGTLVRRDEEEWLIRKKKRAPTPPPPPSPPRDYEKEEIIIRRRHRSVTPPREPTPEPEPEPEPPREPTPEPLPPPPDPIYERPIIREIITHHRHIDHGVERWRSPSPSPVREPTPEPPREPTPPPPSPPRQDDIDIEIRRKGVRNGKAYEEDIHIDVDRNENDRRTERAPSRAPSVAASRAVSRRSPSPARSRAISNWQDDIAAEADYYNRKALDRTYPGEGYNGATKDWGLVDIPPGTERVQMDGVGGGRQEITWERYNGERRSKFRTGDRVYESEYARGYSPAPREAARIEAPPPPAAPEPPKTETKKDEIDIRITRREEDVGGREVAAPKKKERLWTEITKDLVIKEAVDEMGYEYEETNDFFYVIEYLRYEDVLKLVELTEDIRRERRERIRELQWEREESERVTKMLPPPPASIPPPPISDRYHRHRDSGGSRWGEEKIYEKEYYRGKDGRRYR
ncbi:hypothetical protein K431DRAFT_317757 [Polychaeton citri CBS 116435]|uniref:DUF8035 domain-containing protein n=1 Tax=Polychaeton citri CBS 116435 TaxID=1314669 RepID=A0A9P4QGA8_9PEZI|nr:hypothetical protein K431DRAFT_317757 [Polychaeton citri CBS 116435]